jgi:TetR/AcrR family transcriptional regulator, cholesterol catabolism regulator
MNRTRTTPRRDEIIEIALRRFSKYGYAETSTREICADMGLAHSAVYNHFKSKEEILLAIEEREMNTMQAGLEALLELEKNSPAARRAFLAVRFTFQRTIASRESWRLSIEALRSYKPKNRAAATRRRDNYQRLLQTVIDEAWADHHLPEQDKDLAVKYIFGIADGISRWYSQNGRLSDAEIVNDASLFVMRALSIRRDLFSLPRVEIELARTKI